MYHIGALLFGLISLAFIGTDQLFLVIIISVLYTVVGKLDELNKLLVSK